MKAKLRLYYRLAFVMLHFSYGLLLAGLLFPVLKWLSTAALAKRNTDAIKAHWLKVFSGLLKLSIIQEGKKPQAGTLIVSNHISWLDIVVLGQFLPVYFVAKSDILGWPVIGFLAKQGGTIFIRRGDKRQIKATAEQMLWALKQQSTVIAFPEGTTTSGNEVLNFHTSLLQPAILTKSLIHPVALQYQGVAEQLAPFIGDDDFFSHLLRMLSLDKISVRVSFLPAIHSAGRDRQSLGTEARDAILEVITHQCISVVASNAE